MVTALLMLTIPVTAVHGHRYLTHRNPREIMVNTLTLWIWDSINHTVSAPSVNLQEYPQRKNKLISISNKQWLPISNLTSSAKKFILLFKLNCFYGPPKSSNNFPIPKNILLCVCMCFFLREVILRINRHLRTSKNKKPWNK